MLADWMNGRLSDINEYLRHSQLIVERQAHSETAINMGLND
jgi:hypothetical protein